jgi:poly-gamma-glutamate synthesis protein (capsule biosynthesis protein)
MLSGAPKPILPTRRRILAGLAAGAVLGSSHAFGQMAPETRLLLGGDVMLTRHVARLARQKNDPASPLRDLASALSSADIAFVNLESPFTDKEKPTEKGMIFHASPDMVEALKVAEIDIVSTANNHARDCGKYGVEFTLGLLEKNGIAAAGTGKTAEEAHAGVVITRNDLRFGFLAYTYDQTNGNFTDSDDRICGMDVAQMQKDVASLKDRADVIVVSMHAGLEYQPKPNKQQTTFAHAAIDAGASVVAGHHPHVVQPWEMYGKGVIFYSLGNLVFDQFQRVDTQKGLLGEVVFAGTTLVRANAIPVDIKQTVPRIAEAVQAKSKALSYAPRA